MRLADIFGWARTGSRRAFHHHATALAAAPWYADPFLNSAVNSLCNDGFVVIRDSLSTEVLDQALSAYEKAKVEVLSKFTPRLNNEAYEAGKFRRLVNLHSAVPELAGLFAFNKALPVLQVLFQQEPTLYTSLFFEIGSGQALHRDTPYFWTTPGLNYFGVWVALEDIDPSNGPLIAVPQSHLLPDTIERRASIGQRERERAGSIAADSPSVWSNYQAAVFEQSKEAGLEPIEFHVKRGDTIIWHPQTLHGGAKVLDTTRSRKSVAMHVTPAHTRVVHQDYFFDPSREFDGIDACDYWVLNSAQIRQHMTVSLAHQIDIDIQDFRRYQNKRTK